MSFPFNIERSNSNVCIYEIRIHSFVLAIVDYKMYKEIKPSPKLAMSIDTFWIFSNNEVNENFKVLPDACTDLIFDLNSNKGFLSGPMSRFQMVDLEADSNLIGIRFKSENFGTLSPVPLNEVKNLRPEWSNFFPGADLDIMRELGSSEIIITTRLEALISNSLMQNHEKRDLLVLSVAQRIRDLKGNLIVEDLSKSFHLSLRQLQRRFKKNLGLTIKEFTNVIRFKHAERSLQNNPSKSFSQIAFDTGFYSAAHMNYEFNRIAGANPSHFR